MTSLENNSKKVARGTFLDTFTLLEDNPLVATLPVKASSSMEAILEKHMMADEMGRDFANKAHVGKSQKQKLYKVIKINSDTFSKNGELSCTSLMKHSIHTIDAPHPHCQQDKGILVR